jgi:hypothetical protein
MTQMLATPAAPKDEQPLLVLAEQTAGLLEALEQTGDLDGVVALDRRGSALTGLARAARVGLERQNEVAAARVKVQHRAGTLLRELASEYRPTRARRPRGRVPLRPSLPNGTLARYAISGEESSRWQAMASVPLAAVEARLAELCAAGQEITSAEFVRLGNASLRQGKSSRLDASPSELRLRAALCNMQRVRVLNTEREWGLAVAIRRVLQNWGVVPRSAERVDLERVATICLACGRERLSTRERRCICGASGWTSALR